MSKPTPILRRGRWTLDLRAPWGLGQYTLRTPGLPDLIAEAVHEAYEVLERERGAAERTGAQGSIFAGPSFRRIAGQWLEEREHVTVGGRSYVQGYVRCVVAKFGDRAIRQFEPPQGTQLLRGWRDEMAAAGLAPKTRRNYLNVVMQILAYAAGRDLLKSLPVKSRPTVIGETLTSPDSPWYTEADFRALRAGLYVGAEDELRSWLVRYAPGDTVDAYVARRRLYCSFGFYSGMHVIDLNNLQPGAVSPDFGSYWRTNHKSAASVPGQAFDCPEQLWIDIKEEVARLGRPWRAGELICGGRWQNGSRVLKATAERLGLPLPVNFRSVLRRSTVHEYSIRGWPIEEVARLLGHVDRRMIESVYRRVTERHTSPVKIPWDLESARRLLGGRAWTARAKVVPLRSVPLVPDLQREGA